MPVTRATYVHDGALICGVGDHVDVVLDRMEQGEIQPGQYILPDGSTRPYFLIDNPDSLSWRERMSVLLHNIMAQTTIAAYRHAPLIIASSCANIGEIEEQNVFPENCLSTAEHIRSVLDWQGEIHLLPVACTGTMQALILAQKIVTSHQSEDVVVLGVELVSRVTTSGFASMQLLSQTHAQPLGLERDGMVLGEAITLMRVSSAPARWQLMAGASVVSGDDPTGASPQRVAQVCEQAIARAGLSATDIGLIKLQATGSPQNDLNEWQGLELAFPSIPRTVSFKHVIGHTLASSGLAEVLLLLRAMECGKSVDYPYVMNEPFVTHMQGVLPSTEFALALILAFGGEHAAWVIRDTQSTASEKG